MTETKTTSAAKVVRSLSGRVVSDKMDNTVTVLVSKVVKAAK